MIILQATGGNWQNLLLIYGVFIVVIYLVMFRPQMTQQRRRREMLSKLKKGDRIVTAGGLHATIHDLDDDNTLTLEIAPNLRVKADRSAVGYVRTRRKEETAAPVSGSS